MKEILIFGFLLSFILTSSCNNNKQVDKNQQFVKHTDLEAAGLKGKVKSLVTYQCSLGDSVQFCSVHRKKYNTAGFLVEELDTSGSDFSSNKYFYNNDGLLAKVVYSSNDSFLRGNETYYQYSFSDRKKTVVIRQGSAVIDSFVELYDTNGNEIEWTEGGTKSINKYDDHGFLISDKLTKSGETMGTTYINDERGRILKSIRSDGIIQAFVYDKDGNQIQETTIIPKERTTDYLTGYCEFDKNGNFLKRITACKQKKEAFMDRRVIEYY